MFALEPEMEQNVLNPGLTRKCYTQKELGKGGAVEGGKEDWEKIHLGSNH